MMDFLVRFRVVEMDQILKDTDLLTTCRRLSHGYASSGMNRALTLYQSMADRGQSVDARGVFAKYGSQYIGWLLFTRLADDFYYTPKPNHACAQIYVHESYRRKGVGTRLLKVAKKLTTPQEKLVVYAHSNPEFFVPLMNQELCKSVYED